MQIWSGDWRCQYPCPRPAHVWEEVCDGSWQGENHPGEAVARHQSTLRPAGHREGHPGGGPRAEDLLHGPGVVPHGHLRLHVGSASLRGSGGGDQDRPRAQGQDPAKVPGQESNI